MRWRNPAVVAAALTVVLAAWVLASPVFVNPPPPVTTAVEPAAASETPGSAAVPVTEPAAAPGTTNTTAASATSSAAATEGLADTDRTDWQKFRHIHRRLTEYQTRLSRILIDATEGGPIPAGFWTAPQLQTIANVSAWETLLHQWVIRRHNLVAARPPNFYNAALLEEWAEAERSAADLILEWHGEDTLPLTGQTLPPPEPDPWGLNEDVS